MEPLSYWPVEITLDATIIYLLSNSKNSYEIISLIIALIIHIKRQWDNRYHITEVSSQKSPMFNGFVVLLAGAIIWATRTTEWPIPIWVASLSGVLYFISVMNFMKDSKKQFNLLDPKIDLPQTIISASMTWVALKTRNPVSILWMGDFVYHILELFLLN